MLDQQVAFILAFTFRLVLVPLMLLGVMGWAWSLTYKRVLISQTGYAASYTPVASRPETQRTYAFILGICVALLVIIVNVLTSPHISISFDASDPFVLDRVTIAGIIGVGVVAGLGSMAVSRLISIGLVESVLIAILAGASLIGLYDFFTDNRTRDQLLLLGLSFVIGAVSFVVALGAKRKPE